MILPDKFVIRRGGSNWRLFIPLLVADTTTNFQYWSPDAQYNNVNVAPHNEIAMQFSYFAAYWLNRNKAAVGTVLSVPVSSGGTFHFRATSTNPVSSYEGLYAPVNGSYVTLTLQQDGVDAGYNVVTGAWSILLRTTGAKPATDTMGNFQGLLANPAFKTMTVSTANGRKSFGDTTGFYEGFFTTNKITRLALVDGTASLTNVTGNTNYIIYDLVQTSGSETMFQILNRLDTYAGSNQMANTDALGSFRSPSVVNFTAGINGYSGTWSERSAATAFDTSTFPDKICVWGINIDSDDDVQVFAAYWGNLETGKGDFWRRNPSETLWSLWGNDYHINSTNQRISASLETSPGINASVSAHAGDVYLLAFSSGAASLVASQTVFYRKFVSGASISFDVISSNAGAVSRTHESNDPLVVTIPSSGSPSASIAGPGKTTIKVTQPATGNYTQVIENALITIVVVGQGKPYTSETFPASFDLAGTNLSGSVFNNCNLTSANLFGTTVNASTDFTTSTLAQITSGRITGVTSLLPTGFTMI